MKRIFIGLLLLISLIVFYTKIFSNDISTASKLAESGDYKGFYSYIKSNFDNNEKVDFLLINYFLKAIQDKDINEVKFYLDNDIRLIDKTNENGDRAVDVILFEENINIEMLKLLLSYRPNLNYVVSFYNMTPLQVVVTQSEHSLENLEALKLLVQHGADVNYYSESGKSKHSALALSFSADNFKAFEILLESDAELSNRYFNNNEKNKNDILANITGSYVLYLKKQNINLSSFFNKPLSYKIKSMTNSVGYKIVHDKNMKYLNSISNYSSFIQASNHGKESIAKWYIKTKEYEGLKLLAKNKVFEEEAIYKKMKNFSIKENDRTAVHIINQYKGN